MDSQQHPDELLAQEHEAQERAQEKVTLAMASVKLTAILAAHKNGQPIMDEMAARIRQREAL